MNKTQISQKDFEFIKELGSGSFGMVSLVKNVHDDENYAIKTVKLSQMSQKQKDSALNQVRLLASINIPYVVAYRGAYFDTNKQALCIVMQYADGGDLQHKVTQLKNTTEEGFEETFIWKVAYEILNGLKILHKNKIIHRDIKSANIFFSKGIAKLGDLNVSKVAEQGLCETQTGTPYYTSPEIWKGQKYTSKCDIWSTGCLLYEMITLTHPFKGRDYPSLYRKVIVGDYQQIPATYSHQLKQLIRMCLTVDADMRPSASELLQTSVLSGMQENMEKFDSKGEINLIDPIKCPRVLRFLNSKLPTPIAVQRGGEKKKTVNFNVNKQVEKTQGHGFKIHKQANLRHIRSQKCISAVKQGDQSTKPNILTKVLSKKNIKLPPLQSTDTEIKTPLTFTNKKLKSNSSMKKIILKRNESSLEKDNANLCSSSKNNIQIGSRHLIPASSKKLVSQKQIGSGKFINVSGNEKENKKLVL